MATVASDTAPSSLNKKDTLAISALKWFITIVGTGNAAAASMLYFYYGLPSAFGVFSIAAGCTYLDTLVSENYAKNYQILLMNGFTRKKILTNVYATFVLAIAGHYIAILIATRNTIALEPYFDLSLIVKVVAFTGVSEAAFTCGHAFLHAYLPEVHKMHHCCRYTSFSTNFLFDPIDIIVEFATPNLCMIIVNELFIHDIFAFMVASTIGVGWYVLDHNEKIHTYHTKHHLYINSVYSIYINAPLTVDDEVKKIVKFTKTS